MKNKSTKKYYKKDTNTYIDKKTNKINLKKKPKTKLEWEDMDLTSSPPIDDARNYCNSTLLYYFTFFLGMLQHFSQNWV